MSFEINEIVLFYGHKARILGWNNTLEQYIIHRFEEEKGWEQGGLIFLDKKGKEVNKHLKDLSHLWYALESSIKKLNSEIYTEHILEKEDLSTEKLILRKLLKLEKSWN